MRLKCPVSTAINSSPFVLAKVILVIAFAATSVSCGNSGQRRISVLEYQDKVAASWLGQIVGNIYGLSYEFKFLEDPGPDTFPYGYGGTLDQVRSVGGAFSDDDTDIEYIFLLQMESHGPEPTYRQLADAWKYHIRDRIWAANRVALTLMNHGYWPPATGDSTNNPRWFEIDPQLVNEIWAVTAPGMNQYAVEKTRWSARMTNDSFGVEPAMFYAAMYAEAFFDSDIDNLIEIGLRSLPDGSHFANVVREMKTLHRQFPNDWQSARRALRDQYYVRQPYNIHGWEPIDATLNGAAAVLALLYGEGDIWTTLDLACAMGFDADNQAATLTGLLALAQGSNAIPAKLLDPLPEMSWELPFNDQYVNVTRFDLPDVRISDLSSRLARQGEAVILKNGGRIESVDGADFYVIPSSARFTPPFELLPPAPTLTEQGAAIDLNIYASSGGHESTLSVTGELPPGIQFSDGRFTGTFESPGVFSPTVTLDAGSLTQRVQAHFTVNSANLASAATRVLHNAASVNLEFLRDGITRDPAFYSQTQDAPFEQWYGYQWDNPVSISKIGLHVGFPNEEWGWLKAPHVEFRTEDGDWVEANRLSIDPPFPAGDSKYLQPGFVAYDFSFDQVITTAVRIVGTAGGHPVDAPPTYGSIVSELTVHEF